jgi:predicted transcriptional regulator
MNRKKVNIGSEEWRLLRYVYDHNPVTARDVADHVAKASGKARTTVLTVLERLRAKKYLTRRRIDDVYQYEPRIGKAELMLLVVRDFVRNTLGGSVEPFVVYLGEEAKLSEEEVDQLRRIVDELDAQRREDRP